MDALRFQNHTRRRFPPFTRFRLDLRRVINIVYARPFLFRELATHLRVNDRVQVFFIQQTFPDRRLIRHHAHAHARVVQRTNRARRPGYQLEIIHVRHPWHADVAIDDAVSV